MLETAHAVVFLDINPLNPGHTLLVPRSHHAAPGRAARRARRPRRLASAQALPRRQGRHGRRGLNVIVNNGAVAGQTIDHCHWHIIPRFANDSVHWPWPQGKYSGDELGQMKSRIEQEIDNAARAQ